MIFPHLVSLFTAGELYNVAPVDISPESKKRRMEGIDVPEREKSQASAYATGGVIRKYGGPKPEIVVVGDSHALMWSDVIDNICKELGLTVSFYAANGTSPFVKLPLKASMGNLFFTAEEKYLYDSKRLDFIREWKPKIVIIVAKWANIEDIKGHRGLGAIYRRYRLQDNPLSSSSPRAFLW